MIIVYIGMLIGAICLSWYYFKAAGFWLVMVPIVFVVAMATCSAVFVGLSALCFIAFIVTLSLPKNNSTTNRDVLDSIIKSNQREKKIEEEYGIIDFTEK